MHKQLLSTLSLIFFVAIANAQYQVVGQIPNTQRIEEFSFPNKDTGWLCAYNNSTGQGYVYKTTNGGVNWQQQFQCNSKLLSIQFINTHVGFITGRDSSLAFRTNDGGASWERITPTINNGGVGPQHFFNDIFFTDSLTGYIGALTQLLKTTDGGQNWNFLTPVNPPGNTVRVYAIHFMDAMNGVISGEAERNYVTHDAGATWFPIVVCTGGQGCANEDIQMTGLDTLRSVGGLGTAYRTDQAIPFGFMFSTNMGTFETHEINFVNSQIGYAISYVTAIVKRTDDGGATWTNDGSGSPLTNNMNALELSGDKLALYIGTEGGVVIKKMIGAAASQPDLNFSSQNVSPTTAKAGENLTVNYIVKNDGGATAASSTVHFYLSPTTNYSASTATLLGQSNITALTAGANTGNLSQQITIPCNIVAGNQYLILQIDNSNTVVESNENNNMVSLPVTISRLNASASVNSVCPGGSVQLSATGAATYQWSGPGLNSNSATVTVTPSTSGVVNYTVTGTTGTCTETKTITVTVFQTPIVTVVPADTAICIGSSVNLVASGASTYSWSPATGLNTTTGTTVTATPASNTSYTVTGTSSDGCTNTATRTVSVIALVQPTVSISYSGCPSNNLQFTANGTNGGTSPQYNWYVNNVLSGSGSNFNLNTASNGVQVYVTMVSNQTCATPASVNSATITVNCITTALPQIDGVEKFAVSYNGKKSIGVHLKVLGSKQVQFEIYTAEGRRIYSSNRERWSGTGFKEIDLKGQSSGVYYLRTTIDRKSFTTSIVL